MKWLRSLRPVTAVSVGLVLLLAGAGILLAQSSNPNCTLAGCTSSYSQNGIQSFVKTYKYSSLGNVPAATPTDVLTISGSATKTVRVAKIVVGGLMTATGGQLNPLIVRRSAANTGGTSTTPAILPRDTNNSAATAVVTLYTANPASLGTTVGTLDSCRLVLEPNGSTTVPDICAFTYGVNNDQMIALRGVTDILAINFAGAALPGAGSVLDFDVEFTEEP
jgi:hypothetical protein